MGLVYADVELADPREADPKPIEVRAMVDSPAGNSITVNPKSPNIPSAVVK